MINLNIKIVVKAFNTVASQAKFLFSTLKITREKYAANSIGSLRQSKIAPINISGGALNFFGAQKLSGGCNTPPRTTLVTGLGGIRRNVTWVMGVNFSGVGDCVCCLPFVVLVFSILKKKRKTYSNLY